MPTKVPTGWSTQGSKSSSGVKTPDGWTSSAPTPNIRRGLLFDTPEPGPAKTPAQQTEERIASGELQTAPPPVEPKTIEADNLGERAAIKFWQRIKGLGAGGGRIVGVGLDEVGVDPDSAFAQWFSRRTEANEEYAGRRVQGETTWEDVKERPSFANITKYVIEQGASSAADMGTLASGAGVGAWIGMQSGGIAQDRAESDLRTDAELKDVAVALPAAVASAALERLGMYGIFGAPAKTVLGRMVQSVGTEALTEALQNPLEYAASSVGTEKGFDAMEAIDQAAAGAVAGGGMGGGIRGTSEAVGATARGVQGFRENRALDRELARDAGQASVDAYDPGLLSDADRSSALPNDAIARGKAKIAELLGENPFTDRTPIAPVEPAAPVEPVAPPAPRPAPVAQPSGDARSQFMDRVGGVESGNSATAKNPNSSASGLYQFTKGTWEGLGGDWSKRFDVGEQTRLMNKLTDQNESALKRAGVSLTPGNYYLAHFAGSGGAVALHKADPNASAESVLGEAVVKANPFLRDMSAQEVIAWAAGKMGGEATASPSTAPQSEDTPSLMDEYESGLGERGETTQDRIDRVLGPDVEQPAKGQRVDFTQGDNTVAGVVEEIWEDGGESGVRIRLDNGAVVNETLSDVRDAGARITSPVEVEQAAAPVATDVPTSAEPVATADTSPAPKPAASASPVEAQTATPEPVQPAETPQAESPAYTLTDSASGKGLELRGATPEQIEAIREAGVPIPPAKRDGALVFSKKREEAVRAVLEESSSTARTAAQEETPDFAGAVESDLSRDQVEAAAAIFDRAEQRESAPARASAPEGAVTDLGRDDGRYSVATGAVLETASGRRTAPAPKWDASTPRKQTLSLQRQANWLIEEARKEVEGQSGFAADVLNRLSAKNMAPVDWSLVNETLFGSEAGPQTRTAPADNRATRDRMRAEAALPEGYRIADTSSGYVLMRPDNTMVGEKPLAPGNVSPETFERAVQQAENMAQRDQQNRAERQPGAALPNATAPEQVQGASDEQLAEIVQDYDSVRSSQGVGDQQVTHVFDPPTRGEVVRLADKVKVFRDGRGWMTAEEAAAEIAEWKERARQQGGPGSANADKVVLSLFDLSGEWSRPWEEAGYQVYRFDIQDNAETGDVNNFSTEFFGDWFGDFDGQDIYAILAACPCTDFASSGARHFAAKDEDGRTVSSVRLVQQTLATIEYFKPAVWALENPVGRIEKLGGLPPWRLSFDPNHVGETYTKKTLIWGRFNADLPIAPRDPVEGSKMHKLYGGKSLKTKNARSVTPEGFAYSFFAANNAVDHPAMALANKFDRLDRELIERAVDAGVTPEAITEAVEDLYYGELDDAGANDAIRTLLPSSPGDPQADMLRAAQDSGRLEIVDARTQRSRDNADRALASADAANAQQAAEQSDISRPTDKKNPNPFVRRGERYTLTGDIDYLSGGNTYEVDIAEKRSASFRNVETDGRSSLNNYAMREALADGRMVRAEAEQAAEEAEATPESAPATPDYGASNRLVSQDRAAELRARLKEKLNPGRLNAGIDPELLAIGTELAVFHVEAGARRFIDFAKAIRADVRAMDLDPDSVRRYLRGWYNGARDFMEDSGESVAGMDTADEVGRSMRTYGEWATDTVPAAEPAATPAPVAPVTNAPPLEAAFAQAFVEGRSFASITQARAFAKETTGQDYRAGTAEAKTLDEAVEAAVVRAAQAIVIEYRGDPQQTYGRLVDLYSRQPKLGVRTSTSVSQQAYSTPVPLAYLASQRAGITPESTVFEPSAGNGALLIAATPSKVIANELNAARAAQLRGLYPSATVRENDATDYAPATKVDAVIANPPFGPIKGENGQSIVFDVDGEYSTREIDHAIAMKALSSMKDDGSAVLIVGGLNKLITDPQKRADAYNGKAKREFYLKLYSQYNVTDHFTVAGELYERQGAGWPVDVIVIQGRGKSALAVPAVQAPRQYSDWESLTEALNGRPRQDAAPDREPSRNDTVEAARPEATDARNTGERGERGPVGRAGPDTDGEPGPVRAGSSDGQPSRAGVDADARDAGAAENRRPVRAARRDPVEGQEGATQIAYRPGSKAKAMDTLVPVNMAASIDDALATLASVQGDIDAFVADRLGYPVADLSDYYGAEQIDALALAIDNMERGSGFIIGDQTGIGKGRVVAGVIRYAIRTNRNPIFVTEKPNLYRDMFRDMADIGLPAMLGREINVVMTNANEKVPLDEDGEAFLTSPSAKKHNDMLAKLARGGDLKAEGIDALFTTYAQMQTVAGKETVRQQVLESLAGGGIIIMDESHNAGGQGPAMFEDKNAPRSRAKFARDLVEKAHGVFYSSATYAKRPDVMDLYAATDMRMAVPEIDKLGETIAKGGVPMQQVVASMLARSGQYVRRERSFDGIAYNTPSVEIDRAQYDATASILAAIQDFSETYVGEATKAIDKRLRAEGRSINADNATGRTGATSTNFTAIMHNVVDQMLLAFKSGPSADRAIAAFEKGEKPVITVANTLEAFISQMAEEDGISSGEPFDLTFADVFRRYLERSRIITVVKPFAKKGEKGEKIRLTDEDLGGAGAQAFASAMRMIDEAGLEALPASPLDYMISRMEAAGLRVGEITGRGMGLEYRDGQTFLKTRPQSERSIKGRLDTISGFNSGNVDAVLLNRSGSTGLSLHASEKFADKRKRRMIIAQAEGNIDTHMQMLGRVHRTGQVVLPEYDQIVGAVPAEKRPAAVLAKKMASLNANTTAARDSAFTSSETVDFMNEYGDEVAARIMEDDFEAHRRLGEPLSEEGGKLNREGAARKITGRIPLLPIQQQEELYERLETEYREYLEQKEAAGENALEAKTFDLDAETLETSEVLGAVDTSSPFGEAVSAEVVDIKSPVKPFSSSEVRAILAEAKPPRDWRDVAKIGREFLNEQVAATIDPDAKKRTRERLEEDLGTFSRISNKVSIGDSVRLKTEVGNVYGIVTGIERNGKTKNPVANGSWRMSFALLNGNARSMNVPFSQLDTIGDVGPDLSIIELATEMNGTPILEAFDKNSQELRETRTIVTGNILAGFDWADGRGQIINYTTNEGAVRQGILMRRGFDAARHEASRPVSLTDAGVIMELIANEPALTLFGQGGAGQIAVMQTAKGYEFLAAKSKKAGGEFFTNQALTRALGKDFVSNSSGMVAVVERAQARAAVDVLLNGGVKFEIKKKAKDELKQRARDLMAAARETAKPQSQVASEGVDGLVEREGEIRTALERQLEQLGIADRVSLRVGSALTLGDKRAGAQYWRGVIQVSLDRTNDPAATLAHESIHAMRELGLFTGPEWVSLTAAAWADPAMKAFAGSPIYQGLSLAKRKEEAAAEYFSRHYREANAKGLWNRAAVRIRGFLRALARAIHDVRGKPYPATLAADIIADKVLSGEIGAREAGSGEVVRSRLLSFQREEMVSLGGMDPTWKGRMAEAFDGWRRSLQDRYLPLLKVQREIEEQTGKSLPNHLNPYLGEELMTGRIGSRLEKLTEDMVAPLFDAMADAKVTLEEMETYLYARHAPERNARMSAINPDFEEGSGSGMSDIQAAAIMNRIRSDDRMETFERLAERVDEIRDYAVDFRVESGLMSEEQADDWRSTYQNYVPLRGFKEVEGDKASIDRINRSGGGINVRGRESKAAYGRRSEADSPLAYLILQAEEAIVRGETNRVAQRFVKLADANPDGDFWKVNKVETKRRMDEETGLVENYISNQLSAADAPYTVVAKFDGKERRVTMNRQNPAAYKLADAMRRLTEHQMDWLTIHLGKVNRFLSAVNTSYNPEFVITNAFRDIQTAVANMQGIDVDRLTRNTLRDYKSAMVASAKGAFRKGEGPWRDVYEEFIESGGRVYFNRTEDVDQIKKRIEKTIGAAQVKTGEANARLQAKRALVAVKDLIENLNSGVENAVRLAAFKNAREAGLSPENAASLAKNLTVNFNRRGTAGPAMNAAYLFFNASVQGTARIAKALQSKRVQKLMAGVVVSGFALEMLNAMLTGDDDDGESFYDKIPDYEKSRNLIVMMPGTSEYVKIPLPYGYNVFFVAGRSGAEMLRRGGDRWQETMGNFAMSVADSFNPIGGAESLLNLISPTVVDPIVDLYQNEDFAGNPIMPEQAPYDSPVPDSQRYWGSVGPHWKAITDFLSSATGGDGITEGAIEVSPETLEYLAGVVVGAAGSTIDRLAGLAGKTMDPTTDVEMNDVIFARKLVGQKPGWYDKSVYYDRQGTVDLHIDRTKDYLAAENVDAARAYAQKHRAIISLEGISKVASRDMRDLRKAKRAIEHEYELERITKEQRNEQYDRISEMEGRVILAFNTAWNEAMER